MMQKIKATISLIILIALLFSCSNRIYQTAVTDGTSETVLQLALTKIDEPYMWAGRGPEEFDCSGLITWSYKQVVGKDEIFRIQDQIVSDANMNDLYEWNVTILPEEQIKSGDIVFITNTKNKIFHGGLFIKWVDADSLQFLNASSFHNKIEIATWPIK